MARVRVELSPVDGTAPFVREAVRDRAEQVAEVARRIVPSDSGTLRDSIKVQVRRQGNQTVGIVEATAKHAMWVHQGTGLYGPHRQRIRPKRAKFLHWTDKGGQEWFRRSVRGMKGRPFLTDALSVITNPNLVAVRGYTRTSNTGKSKYVAPYVRRRKK